VAEQTAPDAHSAFDVSAEKIAKQLRRYKSRLRDHNERLEQTRGAISEARDFILAADADEDQNNDVPVGDDPAIIAELTTEIHSMTVSDAVMRLDLGDLNAMLFTNSKTNSLNMVYRRPDGNIGWVDPSACIQKKQVKTA
jgi:hypothetical protein